MSRLDMRRATDKRPFDELCAALHAGERAQAVVRRAGVDLLAQHDSFRLDEAVRVATVRDRVCRIRYAQALKIAGWSIPEDLLDDVREEHRP